MPITPPVLDDRRFDDLVSEIIARIPAHTPEWTNPIVGDPGRTIVDLVAWLTDTLLYRVNLIPERQRLAFLRLLDIPMKPARAAGCLVSVSFDDEDQIDAVTIKAQARIDKPVHFETLSELSILPVTAELFYKRSLDSDEMADMSEVLTNLVKLHPEGDGKTPKGYVTTPVFAGGMAETAGIDFTAGAVDKSLWVALLAAKAEDGLPEKIRATLGGGEGDHQALLNVGIVPTLDVPAFSEEIGPRAAIPHSWEISSVNENDDVEYTTLDIAEDTTDGLTKPGVQRLILPRQGLIGAPPNDVREESAAGVGTRPPRLDDPDIAERLVAWLRLCPTIKDAGLSFSWVGINVVAVDQRQTIENRVVGQSDGTPEQQMQLPGTGIEPSTFELHVEESGRGFQRWAKVDDLALTSRDSAAYRLDEEAGTVAFGDGVRGRIPAKGSRVRVVRMRHGGGVAGNIAAGSMTTISAVDLAGKGVKKLKPYQPLPATGGADAELLREAEQRIPSLLRHRERAVTASDYQQLAAETPGVKLGRVEVLPRFKPLQQTTVLGVVSVMVIPSVSTLRPPNPRADRSVLTSVYNYLDVRRPVGTELYVVGCDYVPVGLSVSVNVAEGFGHETVLYQVSDALYSYLWPLAPGGPQGEGWPLGRAVVDRELEVVVARVEGVNGVNGVNLFEKLTVNPNDPATAQTQASFDEWRLRTCMQNLPIQIRLESWQLPELLAVTAVSDEAVDGSVAPTRLTAPAGPQVEGGELAVPVVPEVCH